MKKISIISLCIMALVAFAMWAPSADAFMFYSDNSGAVGSANCSACHTGFRSNNNYVSQAEGVAWGSSLHDAHLSGTTIGSSCNNCHGGTGSVQRGVNLSSSGNAADGVNALACSGCHQGPGLREHHRSAGAHSCSGCHPASEDGGTEDTMPPWYGSVTNNITGTNLDPCNANGEEDFAGDTIGLDNDGDNAYDTADNDCGVVCTPTGVPETECNGIDDDCDGQVDEDYQVTQTFCGVGVCANTGLLECQDGGVLVDNCTELPQDEASDVTCDGRDGDCDGAIDEDFAAQATTCGVGECAAAGQTTCDNGTEGDTCAPGTPSAEICDELDNDCDGSVDEGDVCVVCTPTGTPENICNGVDDDCDGAIDEDFAPQATTCGVGECAASGETTCVNGSEGDTCTPGTPSAEICDELDNDCDGSVDEGDVCNTCTPTGTPETECNGIDDDCDSLIDEDYRSMPTSCGEGECASTGRTTCENGSEGDTCTPGTPSAEICDELDNDCDGSVDEGGVCEPGVVDLDINRFRVSKSVKLGNAIKRIQLTVENTNGGGQAMSQAILIGIQNGVEVYNRTKMVFDMSGNGRSRFAFPPFTPEEKGTINWTVEILDDDPDDDIATATTNVK